jgi:hypothetical protein
MGVVVKMSSSDGRGTLPPPDEEAISFHAMVVAFVKASNLQPSKFVKTLDEMPRSFSLLLLRK